MGTMVNSIAGGEATFLIAQETLVDTNILASITTSSFKQILDSNKNRFSFFEFYIEQPNAYYSSVRTMLNYCRGRIADFISWYNAYYSADENAEYSLWGTNDLRLIICGSKYADASKRDKIIARQGLVSIYLTN